MVSYENFTPFTEGAKVRATQEMERLAYLEKLGLARQIGERSWELAPEHEPELRRRQRENGTSSKPRARTATGARARHRAGDGEVAAMAEYRPYRSVNSAAQARLTRVKFIAVSGFLLLAIVINWIVTQHVARLFGYAPGLGPALLGSIYAPWGWLVWWARWHWAEQLQPVWELCLRQAAYPLFGAGALAAGSVIIARYLIADDTPDLHGSARWANAREVWATGFLAPVRIVAALATAAAGKCGSAESAAAARRHLSWRLARTWAGALSARLRAGPRAGGGADPRRVRASTRWCRRCWRGRTRP